MCEEPDEIELEREADVSEADLAGLQDSTVMQLINEWRDRITKFLSLQSSTVSLVELASHVPRPVGLEADSCSASRLGSCISTTSFSTSSSSSQGSASPFSSFSFPAGPGASLLNIGERDSSFSSTTSVGSGGSGVGTCEGTSPENLMSMLAVIQSDPLQRFAVSGEGSAMRVRRIFRVDDDEIKEYVLEWRRGLAEYLSSQSSTVGLSDIGSNVVRPPRLPSSVKLIDVLRSDPLNRFIITGEGNNIRAKFNFHLSEDQVAALVDQWRDNISRFLSTQSTTLGLSDIGSHVARPFCLPNSIKLLDTLQSDPLGRFALSGEGSSMRARRIFRVDDEEIVEFVEEWRRAIARYLAMQYSTVSLSDIGSNVSRPLHLPTSVKLIDVMRSDSLNRFVLSGDGNNIRAALSTFARSTPGVVDMSFIPSPPPAGQYLSGPVYGQSQYAPHGHGHHHQYGTSSYDDVSGGVASTSTTASVQTTRGWSSADYSSGSSISGGSSTSRASLGSDSSSLPPPFYPSSLMRGSASASAAVSAGSQRGSRGGYGGRMQYGSSSDSVSSLESSFSLSRRQPVTASVGAGGGGGGVAIAPVSGGGVTYTSRGTAATTSVSALSSASSSSSTTSSSSSVTGGSRTSTPSISSSTLSPTSPPFIPPGQLASGAVGVGSVVSGLGSDGYSSSSTSSPSSSVHSSPRLSIPTAPVPSLSAYAQPQHPAAVHNISSKQLYINHMQQQMLLQHQGLGGASDLGVGALAGAGGGGGYDSLIDSLSLSSAESVPDDFLCPLNQDVMRDPVLCSDGYTYERFAIANWLRTCNVSPCTRLELPSRVLTPNFTLRNKIERWRTKSHQEQLMRQHVLFQEQQQMQQQQLVQDLIKQQKREPSVGGGGNSLLDVLSIGDEAVHHQQSYGSSDLLSLRDMSDSLSPELDVSFTSSTSTSTAPFVGVGGSGGGVGLGSQAGGVGSFDFSFSKSSSGSAGTGAIGSSSVRKLSSYRSSNMNESTSSVDSCTSAATTTASVASNSQLQSGGEFFNISSQLGSGIALDGSASLGGVPLLSVPGSSSASRAGVISRGNSEHFPSDSVLGCGFGGSSSSSSQLDVTGLLAVGSTRRDRTESASSSGSLSMFHSDKSQFSNPTSPSPIGLGLGLGLGPMDGLLGISDNDESNSRAVLLGNPLLGHSFGSYVTPPTLSIPAPLPAPAPVSVITAAPAPVHAPVPSLTVSSLSGKPDPSTIELSVWLPVLFSGFDSTLVNSFVVKLREEGGFVTAQDLLDALHCKQLTFEYLGEVAGLKLGHFNRLVNGLNQLTK